jgi:hypothetical protein
MKELIESVQKVAIPDHMKKELVGYLETGMFNCDDDIRRYLEYRKAESEFGHFMLNKMTQFCEARQSN